MHLAPIDWLIVAVYFIAVLAVGVWLTRKTRTSSEFFLAGRAMPAWIAGLAFLSANLGAQEVIGMGASGAKYGIATAHFYWIGAIPAMVFIGLFMMPLYYGSKARSVPEYLRLRFDEKTRALNALTFAAMTILSSGISMYAMARLLQALHVLDAPFAAMHLAPAYIFHVAVFASALIVLSYILLGGLRSAIYNEVLQFFLIVAGFTPLAFFGLRAAGGWKGIQATLSPEYTHAWHGMGSASTNLLGVDAFGLVMGLGFVLSFGYWCTDFLVVQRAMSADSQLDAQRVPLIAAAPKMLFPFLVILPGIVAIALASHMPAMHTALTSDYNMAIPLMLQQFYPTGLLGLGITALLASFMSGMAGNVSAFNTVWTFDIYQAYIKRDGSDSHYVMVGRLATVFGILASIGAAYMAAQFNNIMDVLQLVFAFVNAPLFATFLLGMFWKRTTGHGAFYGLLSGTFAAALVHGLTLPADAVVGIKGGWFGVMHVFPSEMAQNFYTAIFAWCACFAVTILVSVFTKPRDERELVGLVASLTARTDNGVRAWYGQPVVWAVVILAGCLALNIIFR